MGSLRSTVDTRHPPRGDGPGARPAVSAGGIVAAIVERLTVGCEEIELSLANFPAGPPILKRLLVHAAGSILRFSFACSHRDGRP